MTLYERIFDMSHVPFSDPDPEPSKVKASFVKYMNKRIEWHVQDYIRKFVRPVRIHEVDCQEALRNGNEQMDIKNQAVLEGVDNMVSVANEFRQLKTTEQRVYICLYQLDWSATKTARILGCSEAYICQVNRTLVTKLGLALGGGTNVKL